VPIVRAALRGDNNGAAGRTACVGVFLGSTHVELADSIRRVVLQKASNEIVGVVAAIDGQLVVEAGASARRHGTNARLRGVRWFHRLGPGSEVGNVGKAASGKWQAVEVLRRDDALVNAASEIDAL
jgi:hypothetical protein